MDEQIFGGIFYMNLQLGDNGIIKNRNNNKFNNTFDISNRILDIGIIKKNKKE